MNEWSNAKLCDVANLILGAILLASPGIFGFPSGAASQTAVICGIVIVAISIAALAGLPRLGGMAQSNRGRVGLGFALGARICGDYGDACPLRHWRHRCRSCRAGNLASLSAPAASTPRPADCERRSHNGRGVCFLLADATRR